MFGNIFVLITMKNESELKYVLGCNIRIRRESRDLSQEILAEITGVSKNTISDIETGQKFARAGTLIKLANAFGTEVFELLKPLNLNSDTAVDIIAQYDKEIRNTIAEVSRRYFSNLKN